MISAEIIGLYQLRESNRYGLRFYVHNAPTHGQVIGDAIFDSSGDGNLSILYHEPKGATDPNIHKVVEAEVRDCLTVGSESRRFCFLKIDIAEHSRISSENQQRETDATWDAFEVYVLGHIMSRKGEIWGWQGDGGLCAFPGENREEDAVVCAQSIISGLDSFNDSENQIEGENIKVRVSVHPGYAKLKLNKGQIHSRDINFVAHVESARTCLNSVTVSNDAFVELPKNLQKGFNRVNEEYEGKVIYTNANLGEFEDYVTSRDASHSDLQREVVSLKEQVDLLQSGRMLNDDTFAIKQILAEVEDNLVMMEDLRNHSGVALKSSGWDAHKGLLSSIDSDLLKSLRSVYALISRVSHYSVTARSISEQQARRDSISEAGKVKRELKPKLEAIKIALEEYLQEPEKWVGIPWQGNFLAIKGGLLPGLQDRADFNPPKELFDALETQGFVVSRATTPNLNKNQRIVYLTDQKSWKCKVVDAKKQVILARRK